MADTHTVQKGDGLNSLWRISKAYGVSFPELKRLNPGLKDRKPSYWINPGDVIKLPPKKDTGPLAKTKENCKVKRCKITAVDIDRTQLEPVQPGPILVLGMIDFRLCGPAVFKVTKSTCKPPLTDAEKSAIRWMVRDATTKEDLLAKDSGEIQVNGDELIVECVPFDWRERTIEVGAQFDEPPKAGMWSAKPRSAELYDWIALIKKAETAYPGLSGVEMTNAMRKIATYDIAFFQHLYGGSPPGVELKPSGALTQADIAQLKAWTMHQMDYTTGAEVGLLEDPDGTKLAAGHVLTGISGGVYRDTRIDLTHNKPVGSKFDNLYGATISGDLGQAAVYALEGHQSSPPYIGTRTASGDAEMVGDIDGWLIGDAEPKGGSGRKLSEILLDYYCPCGKQPVNYSNRYTSFTNQGLKGLEDEVIRFANTYAYRDASHGWSDWRKGIADVGKIVTPGSEAATKEFQDWLSQRAAQEATPGAGLSSP